MCTFIEGGFKRNSVEEHFGLTKLLEGRQQLCLATADISISAVKQDLNCHL